MAVLYLVRHAQASFGTDDYDRLSELGWQQSRWLGEYFAERGVKFDRVLRGTLRRHDETVRGIAEGLGAALAPAEDPGLNEYNSHELLAASGARTAQGEDRRAHFRILRETLYAWTEGALPGDAHEKFDAFRSRVLGALHGLQRELGAESVLVVSSGGPIATFLSATTGMPQRMMVDLNMQARNTGISEFRLSARANQAGERAFHFVSFNNIPHLDRPGRLHSVTYS